jgi:EAL domain-containing protein (putative c-di-GMP-specific phosphodiesterase class I)
VPMLEESGVIAAVGAWVLETACRQVRAWMEAGVAPVPIAVNLSPTQFHRQDVCTMVEEALRKHRVEASFLEVEITETAAMQDADATVVTLERLKALGVRVTIDDFGTGYSSLSYLQRFPLDSLKLDRSFVRGLPSDLRGVSIALAVITMAHSLGLKVVAEGVETDGEREFLAENECDEIQGYYVARPLTAEVFTRFLHDHRARSPAPAGRGMV